MTEYHNEGGFQFLVTKNFINVGPLLGDGKRDKNFLIEHDDDDAVKIVVKKVLPMGPTTINDYEEENDEVNVDENDGKKSSDIAG
ncbi:hypothetical protein LSTR_LSTR006485 [Laodelphax striatellus]|uniref:Uncharacterized protein n=1 Tax=Laodelphax striatellus TaxID=195883 RepID=A0A482WXQ9_LAOST|nr:hypothetical protein LSTR_LSTR006485 [Laodelphax striatellus]